MNILFLVHALPPHRPGGLERASAASIDGLCARGHRLRVLTTRLPFGGGGDAIAEACGWLGEGAPEVEALSGRPGHPSPAFWRAAGKRARELAGASEGERPAVLAVDLAGMFAPRPFALQMHGTLFSETALDPAFGPFRDRFPFAEALWRYKARVAAWPLYRRMLRRAGLILADSEFILGKLGGRLADKARLVPLALSPEQERSLALPRPPERLQGLAGFSEARPLRLLSVGRLATIKGHEVVAEALRAFASRESGRRFVWSVAGPESSAAADLPPSLRGLEREPWFRPLGRLGDDALADACRSNDFLLNLEFNQPAFGLVALEALAAGCCPIVSDSGALPEVVGGAGRVLPRGDAGALADLLESIHREGPRGLVGLPEACRERAKAFSFERWMDALEAALGEMAG